ncbi:peptidase alpha-lytic pro domain protein [Sarocladium strictum]
MELPSLIVALAAFLPLAYGAPVEQAETTLGPLILSALERDLGLSASQATARFDFENEAGDVVKELRTALGDSFAGAWVEDGKVINVAVSDEAAASKVKEAGATAKIVKTDLAKLQKAKKDLDEQFKQVKATSRSAKSGIALYYVDVVTGKLVIQALPQAVDEAEDLAESVGLSESEFKVEEVEELFKVAELRGGGGYAINFNTACSVGFNVAGGFVSAGHCGSAGSTITYLDGVPVGTMQRSNFPGQDMSYISTLPSVQGPGYVGAYGIVADVAVRGSNSAPVGSGVCRSGITTGWRCGTIQGYDVTVNYAQGQVFGLVLSSACAQPGDSGGSFISGNQAQGVTSGAGGDCAGGGNTVYQPLPPILSNYGLSLTLG